MSQNSEVESLSNRDEMSQAEVKQVTENPSSKKQNLASKSLESQKLESQNLKKQSAESKGNDVNENLAKVNNSESSTEAKQITNDKNNNSEVDSLEVVSETTNENSISDSSNVVVPRNWMNVYAQTLKHDLPDKKCHIPVSIRSSLIYIVLENELALENKRRIVSLTGDDLLYASTTGKCVFLQIDWERDYCKIIKVHESNHTWETSFCELIETRANALRSLFAHSEVWIEGDFKALTSNH